MALELTGISSMATRRLLEASLRLWHERGGARTTIRSIGGVNAFKEVDAGNSPVDLVFLASGSLEQLEAHGRLVAGSIVDIVKSKVAVAVPKGHAHPPLANAEDVRTAVLAAEGVAYSTGPSGVAMLELFGRWGIRAQLKGRLIQAKPGVPVGSLVAGGKASLGFQQRSELIHVEGVEIAGLLPPDIEIITTFCGAVGANSARAKDAAGLLAFLGSEQIASVRRAEGFEA
ncbi:MAG TPA: substrate-binding domain-containing protein [Nevskiaceae bacterium]